MQKNILEKDLAHLRGDNLSCILGYEFLLLLFEFYILNTNYYAQTF
jgi:hypothetical protein